MDLLGTIFDLVINVAALLLGLRFMMQLTEADAYNPFVMATYRVTHVVDVFHRILPPIGQGRVSLAAIMLLFLLKLIELWGHAYMAGAHLAAGPMLVNAVIGLLMAFLGFCKILIFASIILSWVLMATHNPTPVIVLVQQMTEPLYAPFRRILPDLGPIDLSPILAFLAIKIAEILLGYAGATLLQLVGGL